MKGSGRSSAGSRPAFGGKRRVFTKLLRDKNATVSNFHQAKRFIEGMETFDSKAELLAQLQDTRHMGMQRIRDVLSFTNSIADVKALLIPLLRHLMTAETNRPVYRPLRDKMLFAIYNVPGLINALKTLDAASRLDTDSAGFLCSFLRSLTKAFLEPRQSEVIVALAKVLRQRGDVEGAGALCAFLLVDEKDGQSMEIDLSYNASDSKAVACWVTDLEPPGGRHDNDHRNFRNIRILPTVDELACSIKPYLPLASGENHFIKDDPVVSLLDSSFRLLREDAVSMIRERDDNARGTWKNARIVGLHVRARNVWTVSFVIQCDSRHGGNPNWGRSRSLMYDSVVALCVDGKPVRMGTISVRDDDKPGGWLKSPSGPMIGVVFESHGEFDASIEEMVHNSRINEMFCDLLISLTHTPQNDPRRKGLLERLEIYRKQMKTYDLVEVSKSFFAYQPILRALQSKESIPLAKELLCLTPDLCLKPDYLPNVVRLPENDHFGGHECDLGDWSPEAVLSTTSLDASQAEALHHALTSSVALIQGPPGTGKTFLGGLVAQVIRANCDETILCVCYTNHALDQFLEHMLAAGETRLVRIGGRSKSERLGGYQLKNLARHKSNQDSFTQRRIKQVTAQLFSLKQKIEKLIESLNSPVEWGQIKEFLLSDEPHIFDMLRVPDTTDGFEIIGPNGKGIKDNFLWDCWREGDELPDWLLPYIEMDNSDLFHEFWGYSKENRAAMIEQWKREIMQPQATEIGTAVTEFNALVQERQSLCQDGELEILKDARVIGATTSGAAKYRDLLSLKTPGVVIVEEAGEVLEAHILTSLCDSLDGSNATKHLILIGDHEQLPPKVEQYNLTTVSGNGYNLDCSLFERLIRSGHSSVTLEVQHRMRPSISSLIRSQTYPSLKDHGSVLEYPDVKGISKNLVFIDHREPEDGADADADADADGSIKTKSNLFEAELCLEIVRYFLLQGYRTDQIVLLTPYFGQLLTVINLMKTMLEDVTALVSERDSNDLEQLEEAEQVGFDSTRPVHARSVRCSSIDNFQGEEADIVVVSLVRSNKRGNIGFLKEKQRVNVLLSRARHGMVLVGNSSTLKATQKGGTVWESILKQMESKGCVLDGLPTTCQLHPADLPKVLSKPLLFRQLTPNGGCNRSCSFRMRCGHACPLMCHPTDRSHEQAQASCCEPCKRFPPDCKLQHPCPKLCKEDCGRCTASVGPTRLNCEHILAEAKCYEVCLPEAIELLTKQCTRRISHVFQGCGHEVETTCKNSRLDKPLCPDSCGKTAECGHICTNTCGSCSGRHSCNKSCSRILFCGHKCGRPCHAPHGCMPCEQSCDAKCSHSACPKKCSSPCASCVEPCDWFCEHRGQCPLICGAPCARLPCDERCKRSLSCGHRCPSVCGEDCPDATFCVECGDKKLQVVDMILFTKYEDHKIDEDPIIVLPCKHFFAVSTLDKCLELDKVYETDSAEVFVGLKPLKGNAASEKPKQCPECRSLIHSVRRYGRFLRLSELRSLERKHLMIVNRTLGDAARRMERIVDDSTFKALRKIEKSIRRSPMRAVFEACEGKLVEVSPPPPSPLIRCLELRGFAYDERTKEYKDENFLGAQEAYEQAITVADLSSSSRSGAKLRVAFGSLIAKYCKDPEKTRKNVYPFLDWVIGNAVQFTDLVEQARDLKYKLSHEVSVREMKEVLRAMNRLEGYNYGGSAASHWFECPNGHPYFIGECGGAMQESRCIECGEPVGGSSHRLLSSNRGVSGALRNVLGSV